MTFKETDIGLLASAVVTLIYRACEKDASLDLRIKAGHDAEDYLIDLIRAVVRDMKQEIIEP